MSDQSNDSLCYVIVGRKKSGKSTFVKQEFTDKVTPDRLYVYDVNNEYELGIDEDSLEWEKWTEDLKKVRNSIIVVEEAGMELSNRSDNKDIRKVLSRSRHKNNVVLFIFHSLHRVPDSIVHLIDGWYIFKTLDNPAKVKSKYVDSPHILKSFYMVNKLPKWHYVFAELPDW
jgi:hypothetical protein